MILVTGGLGFIGNELVRQLRKTNENILIIDNNNRVAPDIADLKDIPIESLNIIDYVRVKELFKKVKPEVVYHLAAIHFIPECNSNPEKTLKVNVEGTQALLRVCAETGVKKFLFASSGAVYADNINPLSESDEVAPNDIYGMSKLFGEKLCALQAQRSDMKVMICRLFNAYGPRETNFHIIPEILHQLKTGSTLKLGNIKSVRDYIHTTDIAKAFLKISECVEERCSIVNVANGEGYSVGDLIEVISNLIGRKIKYKKDVSKFRTADKLVQIGENNLLHKLTGWSPEVNINHGLSSLLQYERLIAIEDKVEI